MDRSNRRGPPMRNDAPNADRRVAGVAPRGGPPWFERTGLGRFGDMVGRIPILDVTPQLEGGRYAAKAAVGEPFDVTAIVIREGHDAVSAAAVLTGADRK